MDGCVARGFQLEILVEQLLVIIRRRSGSHVLRCSTVVKVAHDVMMDPKDVSWKHMWAIYK